LPKWPPPFGNLKKIRRNAKKEVPLIPLSWKELNWKKAKEGTLINGQK